MVTNLNSDLLLFDEDAFVNKLAKSSSIIPIFKETLISGRAHLKDEFESGCSSRELVTSHACLVDRLLIHAWQHCISLPKIALIAVGGYGRGELCPASDIDLLLLHKLRMNAEQRKQVESFLTLLWDIGLEVGQSVRTVKDCVLESRADVTVATNMLESRLLIGDKILYEKMRQETGPKKVWPTRKYFEAKLEEQRKRHKNFNNSESNLEPNIKEGPGGLRDIHMVSWVAKRHFGAERSRELVKHNFLTEEEYETLTSGREFLWRIRCALHFHTGRREDRLLFEHQSKLAETFGYSEDGNAGVEQFMRLYYTTILELSRLNEMLLQNFEEEIIYAKRREKIKVINNRFQIRNDFIEVKNETIFKRYPFALLEIFLHIQQNQKIKGVRGNTIRLIRKNIELIDDNYRKDIRNKSLFMEIIQQTRLVGHELRRMQRYGVLGKYIPAFGKIEGLMQFDLFHAYTVEQHSLFVVRNMRLFNTDDSKQQFPLSHELISKIPKLNLLYLAGLFHDIAKGRKGNHSTLGAVDAYEFCIEHGLGETDSKLVSWLVEQHLSMARTSQKTDLDDANVINAFADLVGDRVRLNYLYLLTVADMCATNAKLWNSWKALLLEKLYQSTQRTLRRGLEKTIDVEQHLKEIKSTTHELLINSGNSHLDVDRIWTSLGDDFFLRHSPDEIAWRTKRIASHKKTGEPLVDTRSKTERGGSEIFIYMPNQDNIFAASTRAMNQLGLDILDARIIVSNNDYVLNSFIVLDQDGHFISGNTRKKEIITALKEALMKLDVVSAKVSRFDNRKLKHFHTPTTISFSEDNKKGWSIMEIISADHPGLLSKIGIALQHCGVRIHGAKVATYGERAEDIFYITDENDQIITEQSKFECLKNSITESLSENN